MTFQAETKRPVLVHKSNDRNKFKPKPWSHQQDLAALRGKKIRFQMELGEYEGVLVEADQFAIKVRIDGAAVEDREEVFFKHAIFSFAGI